MTLARQRADGDHRPARPVTQAHRPGLLRRSPGWALALVSAVVLVTTAVIAVALGPVRVPVPTVYAVLAEHLLSIDRTDPISYASREIVWGIRLPRVLLGLLVGGGLAACGVVLQALLRNPLADPYLIGVSAGATLGVVVALTVPTLAATALGLPAIAFVGGMLAFLLVFACAQRAGQLPPLRLVLAGVAIGALLTAITQWLIVTSPDNGDLRRALTWMLGSLTGIQLPGLAVPAVITGLSLAAFWAGSRWLDALALGEETAHTLGVNVAAMRVALIVLVAVTVGALVSVSGAVGFVALIVPHAVRMLIGTGHRRLLPLAATWGAIFLVWADVLARVVRPGQEIPLGVVTAIVGAPVFLVVLRRSTR